MKFHELSTIFPMIEGPAFDDLIADIKANGLREKIWLYEGKILDGRNRYLACNKAKVKVLTRSYNGNDPLGFVISLNMQRRHLSESQRGMAAARISTLRDGQKTAAAPIGAPGSAPGVSQTQAATRMNVGRRTVQRAHEVLEKGSKPLQAAVDAGEISVSKAASVVDLPKSEQLAAAKAPAEKPEEDGLNLDERWSPTQDDDAHLALLDKEYEASIEKVMGASDQMKAAAAEIKRQAAEIATLKLSRDGYMNERREVIQRYKKLLRENDGLKRKLDKAAA